MTAPQVSIGLVKVQVGSNQFDVSDIVDTRFEDFARSIDKQYG